VHELTKTFGAQHMTARLRRVLVRAPHADDIPSWEALGWRGQPDALRIADEHDAFCATLSGAGAEVVFAEGDRGNLDAIYTFDPVIVGNGGALLLNPGKEQRRGEPQELVPSLEAAGVPVAGSLRRDEFCDGGDTLWLDERTLLIGRSYRTNDAGIVALQALLPDVETVAFDLPHLRGAGEVLHLLSLLSPIDEDLVVAYVPLLPVRLVELLDQRGVQIVGVPHEEFETMGPNVLALAPRIALALDVNRETRRRLERAGVDVTVYRGEELSKGDGGPTCLTRPLLRV
jgi:dimethylargininase